MYGENADLKQTVEELRPFERLNKDKESINERLNYIKDTEAALEQRQKEFDDKEEENLKIKENCRELNKHVKQLKNDKEDLNTRIDELQAEVDRIKDLEMQIEKDEIKYLDLQAKLQAANKEKNLYADQLKDTEEYRKLNDIVSKISNMIIKREIDADQLNEDEIIVFKGLFGNEIIDAINDAKNASDHNQFVDGIISPSKQLEVNRGTFRDADSKHNDRVLSQMLHRKHNDSKIGSGVSRKLS